MALSSDAALKNPLKGLMLSGMQLLLNAREEELGVEFKIVTKILNREFGISDAFLYRLWTAPPSQGNLAYRHTSSNDLNTEVPTEPFRRMVPIQKRDAATRAERRGLPSAGPRDWQEKRELTARES